MSSLEIKALETNFENWRKERAPDLPISDAFERYCMELVFKDEDLSDEEISSGLTGGGGDGGIDGVYLFVNRQLMLDESVAPNPALNAHLWIVQAKNEGGFGEMPVTKMQAFIDDLLDFSKPVTEMGYYNDKIKAVITRFREKYSAIIGQPHTLTVTFVYATKSDHAPNPNVDLRVSNLRAAVKAHMSSAVFEFQFWGGRELIDAFRNPPTRTSFLEITNSMMAKNGSIVCFARLGSVPR